MLIYAAAVILYFNGNLAVVTITGNGQRWLKSVLTLTGSTNSPLVIPVACSMCLCRDPLYFPKNAPIFSFKNFRSSGFGPAPAVCPHNDGIGVSVTVLINAAS